MMSPDQKTSPITSGGESVAEGTCWFCRKKAATPQGEITVQLERAIDWETEETVVRVPRCGRCRRFHAWFLGLSSKKAWLLAPVAWMLFGAFSISKQDNSASPFGLWFLFTALGFYICSRIERVHPSRLRGLGVKLEYPQLRAKIGEGWKVVYPGSKRPPSEPSVTQLVDRLLVLYARRPDGYLRWDEGAEAAEIRKIGGILNRRGGMDLMRTAHAEFAAGNYSAKRNLEHMWDGIGQWLG